MKKLVLLIFSTTVLTLTSQKATAQWDLFGQLISQMDDNTYNQYFGNLDDLSGNWNIDQVYGNDLLDELYDDLENPFPGGMLDSSYLDALNAGEDLLIDGLPGFGLPDVDEDTILGEFSNIQDIFGNNFDSLGGVFGQYQNDLMFDSSNWNVTIIGFDDLTDQHFGVLEDTLGSIADLNPANGPGGITGIMDQLFNAVNFPDLELAFGIQNADLKYWDNPYSVQAKVLRIGSVPRFDQNTSHGPDGILRLPIEARWHLQASWIKGSIPGQADQNANLANHGNAMTPLLFSGDFAMMATPAIGRWGNTTFKLITSLGMEFGTYAPAHQDYNPPYTLPNQGFATGFGPQAGAGFAMTTGQLTIYSMGTVSRGDVVRCALPYRYNSERFEVGMRFGNVVNVRYSVGHVSWQENDNRRAKINSQLTIGIILGELHH